MPLRRLYRLGPTPQRLRKGYVLTGAMPDVESFRGKVDGRLLAGSVTVAAPPDQARSVSLNTAWSWLHDEASRRLAADALTAAVLELSGLARHAGCAVIPGAVRPPGETGWSDWVAADEHEIAVVDAVEQEVAHNLLRSVAPVVVALTGRAGVSTVVEPLGSRRLAESAEHVATRYLASTSERHLLHVERELRRTTGIRSVRSMDVHPLSDGVPKPFAGSVVVRCVDAQAFAGSAIAHAALLQAVVMSARRRARIGKRVGDAPHRVLERQREAAILRGLDARVPAVPSATRDGERSRSEPRRTTLAALAEELLTELNPELGTLEVGFQEFAAVSAMLVGDPSVPRNETELFARFSRQALARGAELWAEVVADGQRHAPGALLMAGGVPKSSVTTLAQVWEQSLTEPPPSVGTPPAAPSTARVPSEDPEVAPVGREQTIGSVAVPRAGYGSGAVAGAPATRAATQEAVRRISALPQDVPVTPDVVLREAARLASPAEELVPFAGLALLDQVTRARRALRPDVSRQVPCSSGELRAGTAAVRRAQELARQHGIALLVTDVAAAEEPSARSAAAELIATVDGGQRVVLLGRSWVPGAGGERRSRLELLVVRKDEA